MNIINRVSATDPLWRARVRRQGRTGRLTLSLLIGAVIAAALLTGCGGSSGGGVAQIKSSTTSKRSAKSSAKPNPLAFSQCMRSHGVPDFPDPNSSGQIQIRVTKGGGGLNPQSPAFQTASNDCKSLSPAGHVNPAQQKQTIAAALKFATCMRAHGVSNYPDPTTGSGGVIRIGGPGVNPNSPVFQAAKKKCGSPLVGGKALPVPEAAG